MFLFADRSSTVSGGCTNLAEFTDQGIVKPRVPLIWPERSTAALKVVTMLNGDHDFPLRMSLLTITQSFSDLT